MSASIYQPGNDIPLVNAESTLVPQDFTISAFPTTLFNLTLFTYVPGTGSLRVFINGVRQRPGIDFTEIASNAFTLVESPLIGDVVTAEGFVGITVNIPDAEYLRLQLVASSGAGMIGTLANSFLSASTVQTNLNEIVTRFNTVLALNAVQTQSGVAYTTEGSSTAYTVNMTGMTVPVDSLNTRLQLTFDETNTNTTPTIQLTGWGAYPIKVFNSAGAKVNPAIGAIVAGATYDLFFDGTGWVVLTPLPQAASSGSTGDTVNSRLNWIYQAKSFLGYRRGISLFADGYKAADGINAGASSGYILDTANGKVGPSTGTVTTLNPAASTIADTLSTYLDRSAAAPNNAIIEKIGVSSTAAKTITVKIALRNSANNYTVVVSQAFAHPGGGWADCTLTVPYVVPATGNYYFGASQPSGTVDFTAATVPRSYIGVDATGTSGAWTEATNVTVPLRYTTGTSNMTVVTTSQTVVNSTKAKVTLEYDNAAAPVLNTDLTAEVSCNGGTNWQAAALVLMGTGQAGRLVVESADINCTAGTVMTARIKSLNNKNVPLYGTALTSAP